MLVTVAYILVSFVCIWALIVCVQSCAALLPWKPSWPSTPARAESVVLIPAHNEAGSIGRTIRSIKAERNASRVLVIADNCTDTTAQEAADAGADVLSRDCLEQPGKPYALIFGIERLAAAPPEVLVIVDADCLVGGKGIAYLAGMAKTLDQPVQALNLIDRGRSLDAQSLVSILGNRFHNLVRPLGNAKLGLPCLLMGTGMAIPWAAMQRVKIASTSLGEDKQLGIDLALAGAPPTFFPLTKVTSHTVGRYEDYVGQRTRWEQGHLAAACQSIPRLLWSGVSSRSLGLFTLAAELFVPPIAIIALCWAAAAVTATAAWVWKGSAGPLVMVLTSALMLVASIFITWLVFSRRIPLRSLSATPWHVLKKLPIYLGLLTRGPQRLWLRTERDQ